MTLTDLKAEMDAVKDEQPSVTIGFGATVIVIDTFWRGKRVSRWVGQLRDFEALP